MTDALWTICLDPSCLSLISELFHVQLLFLFLYSLTMMEHVPTPWAAHSLIKPWSQQCMHKATLKEELFTWNNHPQLAWSNDYKKISEFSSRPHSLNFCLYLKKSICEIYEAIVSSIHFQRGLLPVLFVDQGWTCAATETGDGAVLSTRPLGGDDRVKVFRQTLKSNNLANDHDIINGPLILVHGFWNRRGIWSKDIRILTWR